MSTPASPQTVTIADAMRKYLDMVKLARSRPTMLAYKNALHAFSDVLRKNSLVPESTPAENLTEDLISPLAEHLKVYAPATEQMYLQADKGFFEFYRSMQAYAAALTGGGTTMVLKPDSSFFRFFKGAEGTPAAAPAAANP